MSTHTEKWTEEKIRSIISNLDKKTGLHGAELPIKLKSNGSCYACYQFVGEKCFMFRPSFINNPQTKESEVVNTVRHEYAHYYVDAAGLDKYIGHSRREHSHGDDWKLACKMVGAIPKRCHNANDFKDKDWTDEQIQAAYNADDVIEFDILGYLKCWEGVPVNRETIRTALLKKADLLYFQLNEQI